MNADERKLYKAAVKKDGGLQGIESNGAADFALEMQLRYRRTTCSNIYRNYSIETEAIHKDDFAVGADVMYDKVLKKDCSFTYDYTPKLDKCTKLRTLRDELKALRLNDRHCSAVVFTHFRETHTAVVTMLKDEAFQVFQIHGTTTNKLRHQAIREFQGRGAAPTGPAKVLVITIRVGAVGMTLTAASRVYIMEPAFNPAAEAQAAGRIHRLGQKREVLVTRFIYRNSIEQNINALHEAILTGNVQLRNGQVPPEGVRMLTRGGGQ